MVTGVPKGLMGARIACFAIGISGCSYRIPDVIALSNEDGFARAAFGSSQLGTIPAQVPAEVGQVAHFALVVSGQVRNGATAHIRGAYQFGPETTTWEFGRNRPVSVVEALASPFVDSDHPWLYVGTEREGIFKPVLLPSPVRILPYSVIERVEPALTQRKGGARATLSGRRSDGKAGILYRTDSSRLLGKNSIDARGELVRSGERYVLYLEVVESYQDVFSSLDLPEYFEVRAVSEEPIPPDAPLIIRLAVLRRTTPDLIDGFETAELILEDGGAVVVQPLRSTPSAQRWWAHLE